MRFDEKGPGKGKVPGSFALPREREGAPTESLRVAQREEADEARRGFARRRTRVASERVRGRESRPFPPLLHYNKNTVQSKVEVESGGPRSLDWGAGVAQGEGFPATPDAPVRHDAQASRPADPRGRATGDQMRKGA